MNRYHVVDVFTDSPGRGNPLAVVHGAEAWSDERMQAHAAWTNLSEATFLLQPSDAAADYRVRIFTPVRELPFAGHPTLGSCHAWLEAGGRPRGEHVVQQCGAGLVRIRRDGSRLAFAAPPLRRSGAVAEQTLADIAGCLRIERSAIRASNWVDNGTGFAAVMIDSRDALLALRPDFAVMRSLRLEVGVVAPWGDGGVDFEVRAFLPAHRVDEDPVTGSLHAGLAQWLIGAGLAPDRYVASQGTALGRAGRVHVQRLGDDIWIGGTSVSCVRGELQW